MENLKGKVALVAGGTRGASRGIAVELGAAGATVYVTGRTTRAQDTDSGVRRSEYNRLETIEDTAEQVTAAGGHGIPVRTDHLDPDQVRALAERVDAEHGGLDILVNGVWGGDQYIEWTDNKVWQHNLDTGLRMLRLGVDTHLITNHFLLPLLIRKPGGLVVEMTDGTAEYNGTHYREEMFFDLTKWAVIRMAFGLSKELAEYGGTAVALSPGWLRSEMMLDIYGVTEENWRDALAKEPHFCVSESPRYVGRAVVALATDPDVARWSGQSLSTGQLARVYEFNDVDGSRPDGWRYVVEVQDAGKPADATGYR